MKLNVMTPFKLTCTLAPRMLARGSGRIVDIASVAARIPTANFFFYNASKGALAAASESLREELRRGGVHVLTVYPGPVHTAMADASFAAFDPSVARRMPTGDVRVLATLIADAVVQRKPRLICPRFYTTARYLPTLARWLADRTLPPVQRQMTHLGFTPTEDATLPECVN